MPSATISLLSVVQVDGWLLGAQPQLVTNDWFDRFAAQRNFNIILAELVPTKVIGVVI